MNLFCTVLLNIFDQLKEIDHNLFVWVNAKASSPLVDWLFMALREAAVWIPLYLFMLYWIIRWHKKFAWQFILFTLLVFAVTDYTSASIMKPFFLRLRPCADPSLEGMIRPLVGCGGRYGMPSTHASNHFGMASFWYFTILWMHGRKWVWLWVWAFLICYAQVYVGKHFPGDVFVGGVLGTIVGLLFALIFRRWLLRGAVATAQALPRIGE